MLGFIIFMLIIWSIGRSIFRPWGMRRHYWMNDPWMGGMGMRHRPPMGGPGMGPGPGGFGMGPGGFGGHHGPGGHGRF